LGFRRDATRRASTPSYVPSPFQGWRERDKDWSPLRLGPCAIAMLSLLLRSQVEKKTFSQKLGTCFGGSTVKKVARASRP